MPKHEPPVIETFSFTFHNVPKEKVGDLHALGARLDLNDHEVTLVKNVLTYAKKINHEVKAEDFLTEWIKDHPTFKISEAITHFTENGRTPASCYSAAKTMINKRVLKKLSEGNYARTDVKQLAAPKKKAKAEPKHFNKTGAEVILSYARRSHGRFNTPKLHEIFKNEGRANGSVSASIDKLLKDKMIKRVGDKGGGQYMLLNKAQTERKKALVKEAPKPDGNGATEIVEAHDG